MVFQEPGGSFNPRRRLGSAIEKPLRSRGSVPPGERSRLARDAVEAVGLDPALLDRHPHELSGGQLQRGALARALVNDPDLLILDEPFTAMDEESEAELVELLDALRRDRGLTLLLITHDMRLVSELTERIVVMDEGRVVEAGPVSGLLEYPRSAVTRDLLRAAFVD
jgi:peptide/nickel transport system ATP-binding protein